MSCLQPSDRNRHAHLQLRQLRRLTSVTYAGPTQTDNYTYDAVGNRLTKNATSYTYDNADQMTVAGGVTYTYDNNGNQTGRGADTFQWDHENRLKHATIAGATSSYTYNRDGLRQRDRRRSHHQLRSQRAQLAAGSS